jgi:hypothetical protein
LARGPLLRTPNRTKIMNIKNLIILFSALLISCDAAQVSQQSSTDGIDPSLLENVRGQEGSITKNLIFKSEPTMLRIDFDNILDHLFMHAKMGTKVEVQNDEGVQNLTSILNNRQASLTQQRATALKNLEELKELRNTQKGFFRRSKAAETDAKIAEASKNLKDIEVKILMIAKVLDYLSDPKNREIKTELTESVSKHGYVPRRQKPSMLSDLTRV